MSIRERLLQKRDSETQTAKQIEQKVQQQAETLLDSRLQELTTTLHAIQRQANAAQRAASMSRWMPAITACLTSLAICVVLLGAMYWTLDFHTLKALRYMSKGQVMTMQDGQKALVIPLTQPPASQR